MQTTAKLICGSAQSMAGIADESVDLIVTSPPYPMVEMWDEIFVRQDGRIGEQLSRGNGQAALALMHELLDAVWLECNRVMKPGGHCLHQHWRRHPHLGWRFPVILQSLPHSQQLSRSRFCRFARYTLA